MSLAKGNMDMNNNRITNRHWLDTRLQYKNSLISYFLCLGLLLYSTFTFGTVQSTLPIYFASHCQSYQGTWHGFAVDPHDLFEQGGPFPVIVRIHVSKDRVNGVIDSNLVDISGDFWGQCKDKQIQKLFVANPMHCGAFGSGTLIAKNALIIKRAWQNAMSGTTFILFLKRLNTRYKGPKLSESFDFSNIKSCH